MTRYLTVKDWIKNHPWPPIGGLRSLIFNKDKNGFSKVVKKVGRTVLIDEKAFFIWVDSHDSDGKMNSI